MISENIKMTPRAYDPVLDAPPYHGAKKAAIDALLDSIDSKKPFDANALSKFDPALMPAWGDPLAHYCMTITCMRHDDPERLMFLTQRLGYPIDELFPYSMGRAPTTPLCLAMSEGRWLVAEALLDLKADPHRLDGDGMHPLALAGSRFADQQNNARPLSISLVNRFAALGQDFNWSCMDEKTHCSISLAEWNLTNTEALVHMAKLGCPIDGANERGETLLMLACQWGCWESAMALLDLGVDPLAANPHGAQALHYLCCGIRSPAYARRNAPKSKESELIATSLASRLNSLGLNFDELATLTPPAMDKIGSHVFDMRGDQALSQKMTPSDMLRWHADAAQIAKAERFELGAASLPCAALGKPHRM